IQDMVAGCGAKPPERAQLVDAMPRDTSGRIRAEILQLVAMNQVDLIEPVLKDQGERDVMSRIIAGRQNFRDRFAF
ncbi:MAG: serine/threonine protein kinase, partial [Xanthobacteraceae bacterium]